MRLEEFRSSGVQEFRSSYLASLERFLLISANASNDYSLGEFSGVQEFRRKTKREPNIFDSLFIFLASNLDYFTRRSGIRAFLPVRARK